MRYLSDGDDVFFFAKIEIKLLKKRVGDISQLADCSFTLI